MRSHLHVDPSSGAMQLQIPLGEYRGRGGINLPVTLDYSSKLWNIKYINTIPCSGGGTGEPVSAYQAEYAHSSAAGWTSNVGWLTSPQDPSLETYEGLHQKPSQHGDPFLWRIARMFVMLPDGSRHELRKDDALHAITEDLTGVYYAVDGSRLRYEWATDTLFMPDGSRVVNYQFGRSPGNAPTKYIDSNGNFVVFNTDSSTWTDTLGRSIGLTAAGSSGGDYTYTIPGVNGTTITYTLRWRSLGNSLTDPTQQLHYKGDQLTANCSLGNEQPNNLFSTVDEQQKVLQGGIFNPTVLYQISLPNNTNYTFTYNVYGEIDHIVYPTGGTEAFSYAFVTPLSGLLDDSTASQTNRGVFTRTISDGTSSQVWTYSDGYDSGVDPATIERVVTSPDGTVTKTWLYKSRGSDIKYGFDDARTGMVREERAYNSAGTMLRRTVMQLGEDGPQSGGWSTATRNARVTKKVDLILDTGGDALASATEMTYDSDLNVTSTKHYDYVSIGQSTAQTGDISAMGNGALLRTEETDYLTNDANYRARDLVSLPTATRVRDGSGNIVAQSSIAYDETALENPGSATGWTDPQNTYRGNATTTSHWLNSTNTYLQTHASYDQFGNVRTATDAKGNQSSVDYSSTYQYAYPTTTTTAVPDPNGTYGSSVAFSATTAYDFNTGRAMSTTDANSVMSTAEYNDQLNRPTRSVRASGNTAQSQSPISYDDTNRVVTGKSDLAVFNDSSLKAETVYDTLGRPMESRQYEGGTNYSAVQTQYDVMGRPYKVSNPFRPWQNETPVWTTSAFDALGRVTSVTTPDGAQVTSSYSASTSGTLGTMVTVTDQAGKKRRSLTDALGRLVRVDEPDNNGNLDVNGVPAQSTTYSYDVLGNLLTVNQGSQTRTFVYDSLSRLTSATNPESGTITYQYDNDGNLTSKTDARGILTTYGYDALNRNTSLMYTNDPANTPAVTRTYDGATNGKGKLWKTQTGGDTASLMTTDDYDALGRPLSQSQQFYANGQWSDPYATSTSYDKAGHVLSQTYPSGHTVNYTYDAAGRLASFAGNLGEGKTSRTYASEFQYTARGGLQQERFGTDTPLYHKQRFNDRGQLWDMRASTVQFATDPANGDRGAIVNYYSDTFVAGGTGADNNGNLLRQDILMADGSFYRDNFSYDALNRLTSISEKINGTGQPVWQQTSQYDRWGNRTIDAPHTNGSGINTTQVSIDPNTNRLYAPSDPTHALITYDATGNQTKDLLTSNGTRTYDAENRMTSATDSDQNTNEYTYDGDGRRVRRYVASEDTETWQVYGMGGELLAEYDPDAKDPTAALKEYGYRNGQLLIATDLEPVPCGPYEACTRSGENVDLEIVTEWLVTDHLGTPRLIFDQTGSLAGMKRHDYLPFGEELTNQGTRSTTPGYSAGDTIRQKFTSKERDNETGLDYFLARYYSSTQGRFSSPDPIFISDKQVSNPQSWNLYGYVNNNPLANLDPTGMERVKLGQHTDQEIDDTIKNNNQQKKDIDKDNSLSKEEKKQQKKALDAQSHTLNLEKEGNRIANQMLKDLDSIGERQGLQVSDFTLSTDPTNDFAGIQGIVNAPVTRRDNMFVAQGYSKEIFIDTKAQLYLGMKNGAKNVDAEDFVTLGGTVAVHERSHRDSKTGAERMSEPKAYTEQFRVLQKFGPQAFKSSSFYYDSLRGIGARTH